MRAPNPECPRIQPERSATRGNAYQRPEGCRDILVTFGLGSVRFDLGLATKPKVSAP